MAKRKEKVISLNSVTYPGFNGIPNTTSYNYDGDGNMTQKTDAKTLK